MPEPQKKKEERIVEKFNRKVRIGNLELEDFTMGADPELRFKGVSASALGIKAGSEYQFGLDGCAEIAELRPTPEYDPINITNGMGSLLSQGWAKHPKTRELEWLAGSYQEGKPLGGHIHFGSDCNEGMDLKIRGLNSLVAPVILMLEHGESAKSRRRNYGKLTDRAYDKHPEYGGFEYRVLPSWLVSKNFCAGSLSLSKVVMFEAHNKGLRPGLMKRLKFLPYNTEFENNFHAANKVFFIHKIPTIYRIVKKLTLFPRYEKYINYLFNYIYQGRTWDENLDIKTRWNIVPKNIKVIEKPKIITKIKPDLVWAESSTTAIPF